MQSVTISIATLICFIVVILPSYYAFAAYITVLLWYPSYMVMSIGTIDVSVGRAVVGVLIMRCLFDARIRSYFKWFRLDSWVALSMIVYVGVYCATQPSLEVFENQAGFVMDTWLAYLVARLCIANQADLIKVVKWIGIVLAPLAILGIVESCTGWQPFLPLRQYCPWYGDVFKIYQPRWGLTRAVGPFLHSILFGTNFAMFLPLVYYLRHEQNYWGTLAYVLAGLAFLGALSGMSSGPWVMVIVAIFCLVMERYKRWVKHLFILFLLLCIFITIVSNRSFYHVMASNANPLGGASWHRARLIDVAIKHFDQWWLVGYGGKDPGWGHYLGMSHTDLTNQFIVQGVGYGILGIIALCGVLFVAFQSLIRAYKFTQNPLQKSLIWALGSILFSVVVVWMSVSFFGQLLTLFYCVLGIIGSVSLAVQKGRHGAKRVVQIQLLQQSSCGHTHT